MDILYPNGQDFAKIIKSKGIVFVDFFATWCGPCKMLSPVMEQVKKHYGDEVTVVKVDIDKEPDLAKQFDIMTVPTLFFFQNGEIKYQESAFMPFEKITGIIDKMLYGKIIAPEEYQKDYDIVIIGSGTAGLTAALYASRAGLKVAVLEYFAPGGKMLKTYGIENWPGIKEIDGVSLATSMYEHATSFGAKYVYGKVKTIKDGNIKEVVCEDGRTYHAPAIIVASGTVARTMNIPGELEMIGQGVSFCAICDGAFYKDQEIIVVGGGNAALEEAILLTQFASKVTIVIRRDVFRADQVFQDEILQNSKIGVVRNCVPQKVVVKDKKVQGLVVKNTNTDEVKTISAAGIFPYIGDDPETGFVKHLHITDENGYIVVDRQMQTDCKGVFAAGDVCEKELRQLVTAANDGAIAAQSAFVHIKNLKN